MQTPKVSSCFVQSCSVQKKPVSLERVMRFFCWTMINLIFGGQHFKHLSFEKISSKTGKCGGVFCLVVFWLFFLNTKINCVENTLGISRLCLGSS